MPLSILSATQRRLLSWGVIVVALGTVFIIGLAVARGASGIFSFGKPAAPIVTQQSVVEHLRRVAKLVSVEMTLRDVVTYEQTQYRSTKRALLVVTARVSAGIDLSTGTDVRIDSTEKRIIISLPPSKVMSVDVLDVTTYDERAGLWNPFRAQDRDVIQRRVREHMLRTAEASGILKIADESATEILTGLLTRDGFTVEVRRPPVVRKPPG